MDDLAIVQFIESSQTSLEDFFFGSHWCWLPDKAQEVVLQVLVHKYALIGDGVPR
jgi:hypothetical protein